MASWMVDPTDWYPTVGYAASDGPTPQRDITCKTCGRIVLRTVHDILRHIETRGHDPRVGRKDDAR